VSLLSGGIEQIERATGFASVVSAAAIAFIRSGRGRSRMPGMMDTILNVGLWRIAPFRR